MKALHKQYRKERGISPMVDNIFTNEYRMWLEHTAMTLQIELKKPRVFICPDCGESLTSRVKEAIKSVVCCNCYTKAKGK